MTDTSITIGVTAYNAAYTIGAALESALAQDVDIAQIVVVDDASTDDTVHVIQGYEDQYPHIELICQNTNQGVAAARNAIIEAATGAFIAFFDDDDISAPNRVRLQRDHILAYEVAHANGAPVICHTARTQVYPDGTQRMEAAMGAIQGEAPNGREVLRFTLLGEPLREGAFGSCATCSQMARLRTYRNLGGFDPDYRRCEDSDLALRLAKAGGHFTGLATPLVTQQMTGTEDKGIDALAKYFMSLLDKHSDVFDTAVQQRFSRKWALLKFTWLANRRMAFATGLITLSLRHPIQTARRLLAAVPNLAGNRAFRRFARSSACADG